MNEINFVGVVDNNGVPLSSSDIVQGFQDDCWLVENLFLHCAKLVMQCGKDLTLGSPDMNGVDFVNLHAPSILKMFQEATKHFDFNDEPYKCAALHFYTLCQCTNADAEKGNDAASIKSGFVGGRFILGNGSWAWSGLHHWHNVHGRGKNLYHNLNFHLQLFRLLDKDEENTKKLSALVRKTAGSLLDQFSKLRMMYNEGNCPDLSYFPALMRVVEDLANLNNDTDGDDNDDDGRFPYNWLSEMFKHLWL